MVHKISHARSWSSRRPSRLSAERPGRYRRSGQGGVDRPAGRAGLVQRGRPVRAAAPGQRGPPTPPRCLHAWVTQVVNDAASFIDTDLPAGVKIALNQSGKVAYEPGSTGRRSPTIGNSSGATTSRGSRTTAQRQDHRDPGLCGEHAAVELLFQLNLVDTRQDLDAWSGEARVTKQDPKRTRG